MSEKRQLVQHRPGDNYDVGKFHRRFNLDHTLSPHGVGPRELTPELLTFRTKFMREELHEFEEAAAAGDHAKMFDALLDLVYVAHGTAHLLGYPWDAGWREVQLANMAKVRCALDHKFIKSPVDDPENLCVHVMLNGLCLRPQHEHSLRGNVHDVIKPPGWEPPNIAVILWALGWKVDVGGEA